MAKKMTMLEALELGRKAKETRLTYEEDNLLTMTVTQTVPATLEVLEERLSRRIGERECRKSKRRYGALSDQWLETELAALKAENETAWAQAHRLALELECLLLDTKDNATVSKWWDSGMEALSEYQQLKPGAAEEAEAWAKMRKEML